MSRRHSKSQIHRYSDRQAHLHKNNQTLQILAARPGVIQNQIRRVSNNLLQACPNIEDVTQSENFGNTKRDLNSSIQNLTNLPHDIAEFLQFLFPFNTPPSPPNSCYHSRSSERLTSTSSRNSNSNSSDLPTLLDNYYDNLYESTVE